MLATLSRCFPSWTGWPRRRSCALRDRPAERAQDVCAFAPPPPPTGARICLTVIPEAWDVPSPRFAGSRGPDAPGAVAEPAPPPKQLPISSAVQVAALEVGVAEGGRRLRTARRIEMEEVIQERSIGEETAVKRGRTQRMKKLTIQ